MADSLGVIKSAAALSSAAPQEWRAFLAAVEARTDQVKNEVISSTLENLHGNQGRAREAVMFVEILRTCREQAVHVVDKR